MFSGANRLVPRHMKPVYFPQFMHIPEINEVVNWAFLTLWFSFYFLKKFILFSFINIMYICIEIILISYQIVIVVVNNSIPIYYVNYYIIITNYGWIDIYINLIL